MHTLYVYENHPKGGCRNVGEIKLIGSTLVADRELEKLQLAVKCLQLVSDARAHQNHEFDVDAWYVQVRSVLEFWENLK